MYRLDKRLGRLLATGLAAVPLMAALTTQAQPLDLRNGLKAYWNFENNLEDSVGIFDGTAMGTAPLAYVNGKPGFGKALKMDGEDQFVEITGGEPDDLAFAGGSMTVAGWFKVDAFDTSWQALVAKGEGSNWRIHRRGGESGFAHAGGTGEGPAGIAVDDGLWHHFAAISDATGANFGTAMYVDGVLYTSNASTPNLAANGKRAMIGENPDALNRQWEGELDDIAMWDRVLTPAEITALYANGAGKSLQSFFGTRIEVLGVGAESLVGKDLTDPENDGDEDAGAASPTWNWAGITASHEPAFGGGENSFNIFDNKVGGGNDKWCCDDPKPGSPVWVSVEFPSPVSITSFTVTSGNDSPDRDPTDWAIQGSADGATFTDIYRFKDTPVPWTARNQVVKFTLVAGSAPYRYIRYIAYDTPGTLHQINEVELFGNKGGADVAFISAVKSTVTTFNFRLNDQGASVVDAKSVQLSLDGSDIPVGTLTKTDGKIDVSYKPAKQFLPGTKHTYAISAKDNFGNDIKSAGDFTTINYALLTAADKVNPNTTRPGFIWNVHQNAAFQANDNVRPINQLAGNLGVNQADPSAQGSAIAAGKPGANDRLPVQFEVETVINFDQNGGSNGNAQPDDQMPGIPGTDGGTDGIAGEVLTYIDLPAGMTTFIVNSDDGFVTFAGNISDVFDRQTAGFFSGGRGAADTAYDVFVEAAGVYPFRTVWEEGGGGANLEWLIVKADGTKVLINDTANGGPKAYRALAAGSAAPTAATSIFPAAGANAVSPDANIEVIISEGSTPVGTVTLSIHGTPVTPTVTKNGSIVTVSYNPPSDFAAPSSHKVEIKFAGRTEEWSFSVPPVTKDKTTGKIAFLVGSAHTDDKGGRSGAAGDYALDTKVAAGTALVPDATFLNAATAAGDDTLTIAFSQKLRATRDSSAFWANSTGSNNGTRGFQAHVPWSNGSIYFDTSGCCGADTQRIDKPIADFADFTGAPWWQGWHHFTFVKDGAAKRIYIDGKLFHEGGGDPLPTDFTNLVIGGGSGAADNRMNGMLDDFVIYNGALTEAQAKSLSGGAAPSSITGLIAHWDFNDPPAPQPTSVMVKAVRNGTKVDITSDPAVLPAGWVLQTAPSVTGPWTTQAGATTPTSVNIGAGNAFLRAAKP